MVKAILCIGSDLHCGSGAFNNVALLGELWTYPADRSVSLGDRQTAFFQFGLRDVMGFFEPACCKIDLPQHDHGTAMRAGHLGFDAAGRQYGASSFQFL
jgi:hypothetical protein